jgi:alpha-galactosidase
VRPVSGVVGTTTSAAGWPATSTLHSADVYNSWYATAFDVRPDHQLALADRAAELGVEAFVLDDGWFADRTDDRRGLGNWWPDPLTFPDGLDPLISGVLDRGLRFGLWVEPEAVSPDADVLRDHPDWIYRAGDRPLVTVRNQYVLDFGRPDVLAWTEAWLRRLLADQRITYLKWDMNRPISDGGRPGDIHGRRWAVQHAQGYYRVMRMLRTEFPHVTVEACSGGGGRIDPAVLAVSDVVWPSDETGPRDRLAIQHGFLSAYGPHVMSSWVTDEPDHRDVEPASLEFRFLVAMAGVLGIGADLLNWTERDRARAAWLLALYRRIRRTIFTGRVEPHGNPADACMRFEYGAREQTVLLVYGRANRPTEVCITARTIDLRRRLSGSGLRTTELSGCEAQKVYMSPSPCPRCGRPHPGCTRMNSMLWRPVPLSVRTDPVLGGRWTSLPIIPTRMADGPILIPRLPQARKRVLPGAAVRGAGGAEECFPTIRGNTGPR